MQKNCDVKPNFMIVLQFPYSTCWWDPTTRR